MNEPRDTAMRVRRMGIDTQQEFFVYMRRDCHVCRAEGFDAQTRVHLKNGKNAIIATLNVVDGDLIAPGYAGLSDSAWHALGAAAGDHVLISHAPPLDSMSHVRAKIYGHRLNAPALDAIVGDIAQGRYPDTYIAAFLSACGGGRMDLEETVALTRAMVTAGERIDWHMPVVADKHCVGGLPGNRTTPIVVAIATAAGLVMPKTSSRAITSPAGTADVMETMTHVALDVPAMRRVVEREGGCFVWGGALTLSPADDMLIRVERPLDLDSDAQLVASVLSKKIAAGATHTLIDIPVGPTAKVRSHEEFHRLKGFMEQVAHAEGMNINVMLTEGSQPVGRGIGPALEARDVLAVLRGAADAPQDLRSRSLAIAGRLLEFCGIPEDGVGVARYLLDSGAAWKKFQAICEAQGGLREPSHAPLQQPVLAERDGIVRTIDSRLLSRIAKLAGAPHAAVAGLDLHVKLGQRVARGTPLFTLHAEAPGELSYAAQYLEVHPPIAVEEP